MSETKSKDTSKEEFWHEECCPFCFLMKVMKEKKARHSEFYNHIYNAQIEVLQAFKSLIDGRISALEKRGSGKAKSKKATKIKVE